MCIFKPVPQTTTAVTRSCHKLGLFMPEIPTSALTGVLVCCRQVYYIATSRELKRLDSLALSPIFGNFNESLQGLLTLRAFRKQDQFTSRNHALLDKSNRCWWPIQVVNR